MQIPNHVEVVTTRCCELFDTFTLDDCSDVTRRQPDTQITTHCVDMGKGDTIKSTHRSREKDSERKHRKRRKDDDNDEGSRKTKHRKKDSGRKLKIVDDNPDDEDMWVEKNIDMDGERVSQFRTSSFLFRIYLQVLATNIPTAESLKLTSSSEPGSSAPPLPPAAVTESTLKRDDWMLLPKPAVNDSSVSRVSPQQSFAGDESLTENYGEPSGGSRSGNGVDFFSSLGTEINKKNPKSNKPDPDRVYRRLPLRRYTTKSDYSLQSVIRSLTWTSKKEGR